MKSSFGHVSSVMFSFKKDFIYLFSERRREGERGRETAISNQLPLAHPPMGTWPATHRGAQTGNHTSDFSVHRPAFNPLSHSSHGFFQDLKDSCGLNSPC